MLDLILLLDARYDGRLTGSAVEMGAAPGGGHGQPPRGRASRLSRGAGGALWRTAGGARKAEARPAATEDEPKISNPNLVIPCGKVGLVYLDGCSALRPRPVYTRVHDLGCKATPDTYGSLRYVYLQLPNILYQRRPVSSSVAGRSCAPTPSSRQFPLLPQRGAVGCPRLAQCKGRTYHRPWMRRRWLQAEP
jgi:hypothetical protein